jgi:hypothetical protein
MNMELMILNVIYTLAGLATHIFKRATKEKINPIEYVRVHKARAGTAFGIIATAFGTLVMTRPEATPMEFFAIGYLGDSIFNKQPTKEEVETKKKAAAKPIKSE